VYENIAVLLIRDVLSWIPDPIPDHGFPGSRIPDLGSWMPDPGSRIQKHQQQRRRGKIVVLPFYLGSTNFTKLKIMLFLNRVQKKIGASLQRTTL
jgi:hypothetical protein